MRRRALRIRLQRLRLGLVCTGVFVSVICNTGGDAGATDSTPPFTARAQQWRRAETVPLWICGTLSPPKTPQLGSETSQRLLKEPKHTRLDRDEAHLAKNEVLSFQCDCLSQENPHCRCVGFHINVWPRCRSYSVQACKQTDTKNGSLRLYL